MLTRRNFLSPKLQQQTLRPKPGDNLHLLNRISYGVLPADLSHLRSLGTAAYIEEQLYPEHINDDAADAQLRQYAVLQLDRRQLAKLESSRIEQPLQHGMVARAVHSKRQLFERLVEFWTDHFNVPVGDDVHDLVDYHKTIRKHALGNFGRLLAATAKHPAMLVYLDNDVNVAEHPNENYARELLELHTMGVDGGYTEQDVRAVARAFTGWTTRSNTANGFYFQRYTHDTDPKTILGHTLPGKRGIDDGLHLLNIVATHPATAQFICRKLCIRFVADDPPATLVASAAQRFLSSNGDIREVLRHILLSAEFNNSKGQKLRRPLDFLIGSLRATQTRIHDNYVLDEMLDALDQRPFNWHPPNGYPDVAAAWASPNGLLTRWNVAMQLTHAASSDLENGWGLSTSLHELIGTPKTVTDLVNQVTTRIIGEPLSAEQSTQFIAYASDGQGGNTPVTTHLLSRKLPSLFGLILASPLYQWR